MNRRQRGESLSERLRSEVQVSAALWQIGPSIEENAKSGDAKPSGNSRRASAYTNVGSVNGFPCPREVKPLLFFYKYLQPIGSAEGVAGNKDTNGNSLGQRKLKVNLPLTVVCERTNAQEMVLWLRTDAQGNVVREEKTPLWRKKLHNDLLGATSGSAESDPVLAVRSVARWKSSNNSDGGSSVVLTRRTLDPVVAVPCELPICIQQFVHCRGSQASVYRIFWCEQERKCFAVNLTTSLKSTEAPEDADAADHANVSSTTSSTGLSASTMAAMNAAFEAAMATAAQIARFYCVTVSPDARDCARWPKLRGAAIAEGVQAISRVVEHVQLQLPALRFHSMTVDFIKDTAGVWWLTRVVDFTASSIVEPPRDESCFSTRDSAVLIPEALRTLHGRPSNELQMDEDGSPPRTSALLRGDELNNAPNARTCFLCGCSCELSTTFRNELQNMLKAQSEEDSSMTMGIPAADEYRMTLTMALDTVFLMRQRGLILSLWENAVSTVRKSQLRDVCDFPVCMLCYRVYQQQSRLQTIARELHNALSPSTGTSSDRPEYDDDVTNGATSAGAGVGMAASAASGLTAPQLLSTELRRRQETPKSVLDALEAYRAETIPPALLLRGDSPEMRPTWSILTPMRGTDVDPTATQLRLVFFFHELQDGGPDLVPTDFYLEYQLGQGVTRVQLEGSKRHTPNRWQLCEARVHYLCATLDAFSEFCSHKRLLIKLKAKARSPTKNAALDTQMDQAFARNDDDGLSSLNRSDSPSGSPKRRHKEEFFGFALLSLRQVVTAAKWFGNSLQPESRTDYLLELHTASHGPLTLKLTVGLLVDPVPLGHVRDVLRDSIFLEEQPPRGVYWPPSTHCLGGIAVPRDWIGALMPSEYTKILPMRRREAHGAHTFSLTRTASQARTPATPPPLTKALTRRKSAELLAEPPGSSAQSGNSTRRRISKLPMDKDRAQTTRELPLARVDADVAPGSHSELQSRPLEFMSIGMTSTTLTRACMAAKRIVLRITEDAAASGFPTALLGVILRHASFANPVATSCFPSTTLASWKVPARFHFTRRYSVDRLFAEVKPGSLPVLALLGELLLVLLEDREVPVRVDANALERLLEPFWQQVNGLRAIPRTETSCLPERRVLWNRAIRRWEAASGEAAAEEEEPLQLNPLVDANTKLAPQKYGAILTLEIGHFRAKNLALVLCELFEQMETLDNGYIEIAELRSLAKCLPDEGFECAQEQLDLEIGSREKLSEEDVVTLADLVEKQRRLALRTLLRFLVGSDVMVEALARFDRLGSGEMSLEEFRELASEALLIRRKVFRAFQEEPRKTQDGFCLRHGFTDIYAADSVCVLCSTEYQAEKSPSKPRSPDKSLETSETAAVINTSTAVDVVEAAQNAARKFSTERPPSRRDVEAAFLMETKQDFDPANSRRASSPPKLERLRRLSSGKIVLEDVPVVAAKETGSRRRRAAVAATSGTTREMVDVQLDNMLDRLHAAERTIVIGEAQGGDRKLSLSAARARQTSTSSTTEDPSIRTSSSCSDLKSLSRKASRKSMAGTALAQKSGQEAAHADQALKKKKRIKKKILKETSRRLRSTTPLPSSASLSKLLRMEFTDRKQKLATSASESIIEKAVRVEEKRKQLDRLVLAEVQEVKRRLAKLLDES